MTEEIRVVVVDDYANRIVISQELQNVVNILTTGIQGAAGTQIITGDSPPSNSIGRIGDYYFDKPAGNLYGPKDASGWPADFVPLGAYLALDELIDVNVPTAQEQDVLMYDESTNTWKNQRIRHRHDQPVPSDEWVIPHGLNTKPAAVAIFDTSNTMVFGDVDHVDENNLVIRFSAPFAGTAYLT